MSPPGRRAAWRTIQQEGDEPGQPKAAAAERAGDRASACQANSRNERAGPAARAPPPPRERRAGRDVAEEA